MSKGDTKTVHISLKTARANAWLVHTQTRWTKAQLTRIPISMESIFNQLKDLTYSLPMKDQKARCNTDADLIPGAARDFSTGVNFQCRLLRCPYSPCVQIASASVRTLKIPNFGSHAIVWTDENTSLTDRNGSCCSYSCCTLQQSYPGNVTWILLGGLMKYIHT